MVNTAEFRSRLEAVEKAERDLEALKQLQRDGGQYRLKMTVDHTDPSTVSVAEAVAAKHLPGTTMMQGLITWAEKDAAKARADLMALTAPRSVDSVAAAEMPRILREAI